MALDQSALLEVLEALKAAEVDDRIRQAAETIYQALIEAELTVVIGAHPHQRTEARAGMRNASLGAAYLRALGRFQHNLTSHLNRIDCGTAGPMPPQATLLDPITSGNLH